MTNNYQVLQEELRKVNEMIVDAMGDYDIYGADECLDSLPDLYEEQERLQQELDDIQKEMDLTDEDYIEF